jgi:hypothetical protein
VKYTASEFPEYSVGLCRQGTPLATRQEAVKVQNKINETVDLLDHDYRCSNQLSLRYYKTLLFSIHEPINFNSSLYVFR